MKLFSHIIKYFKTSIITLLLFKNIIKYLILKKYLHFLFEHPLWYYSMTFPSITEIVIQVHINITIIMCTTSADTIYQILYWKMLFWPLANWLWGLTGSIFLKNEGGPHYPTQWGNVGHPLFLKKGAPRGPSQNFFLGRLIAMHKCYITSIVQKFKYKVYEKNLEKCSQMAHITPPPPKLCLLMKLPFARCISVICSFI